MADYRTEFGTTEVVNVELMPTYAAVRVPVEGGEGRWRFFYYDDDDGFSPNGAGAVPAGTATVDLAEVDAAALEATRERALETLEIEDPEVRQVVIADDYDASLYRSLGGLDLETDVP